MYKENIKVKCPSCGKFMRQFVEILPDRIAEREMTLEDFRQGYSEIVHMVHYLTSYVFMCSCGRVDEVQK